MSDTIAIGIITGAVAIISTLLTQVLSGRSARQLARAEPLATSAKELHPLAMRALTAWGASLSDARAVESLAGRFGEEPSDLDGYSGPGRPSYRDAMAALDEIRLVTDNVELYGAIAIALLRDPGRRMTERCDQLPEPPSRLGDPRAAGPSATCRHP